MKYSIAAGNLQQLRTPCLITGLKTAKRIARALGEAKQFSRSTKDFDDAAGKSVCVHLDGAVARMCVLGGLDNPSAAVFSKNCIIVNFFSLFFSFSFKKIEKYLKHQKFEFF